MNHVMAHAVEGELLFKEPADYLYFLSLLLEVKRKMPFLLLTFCLMHDHIHLFTKVMDFPLQAIMHDLMGKYAAWFNEKYDRRGHLLWGRYKSKLCTKDAYYLALVRYIHLNPVKDGYVRHPGAWKWSSFREFMSLEHSELVATAPTLAMFHPDPKRARELFARFVCDGLGGAIKEPNWEDYSEEPRALQRDAVGEKSAGMPLPEIALRVAEKTGVPVDRLRSRRRSSEIVRAREAFVAQALAAGAVPIDLATYLGHTRSSIVKLARRAEQNLLAS